MSRHLAAASALFGLALLSPGASGQTPQIQASVQEKLIGLRQTAQASDIDAVAAKAVAYLRKTQEENGGWSTKLSPGVTGIVVTGLIRGGNVSPDDPMVAKGLKFIEGLINTEAGHIAGNNPRVQLQNYVTSVNVMALSAAKRDSYKTVVADAAKFLKKLQWDEAEGKGPDSDFFGGAGYDSKSRPDLSNTAFFLEALKEAGIPKDDPAYKKAMVFVSRCQNLKGEHNDQPWAGKVNDGSFLYSSAAGGSTKSFDQPDANGGMPGYASITYAGIKSLIYCGLSKDDPRVKAGLDWLRKNYDLNRNPGMPAGREDWGLFYALSSGSKMFAALGEEEFTDAKGAKHPWRKDMLEVLAKRQKADGSWTNEKDRWMEGDANLVTGFALMALGNIRGAK
jgi:squalene-hopene/tetraprenyl-beta-curcumene cyclase